MGLVAKAAPYTRVCNIRGENAYLREGICFNHQCQATRRSLISFFVMFAVAGVEEADRSPIILACEPLLGVPWETLSPKRSSPKRSGGNLHVSGLGGRLVSLQTKLSFLNHPDLNDLKKWGNKPGAATADKFEAARRRKKNKGAVALFSQVVVRFCFEWCSPGGWRLCPRPPLRHVRHEAQGLVGGAPELACGGGGR